ncbi:MAG TPA: AAA family ATPase, partial [Bacteroidales bacterium]|nr:AAA family ATPase [Bacteroidales bacterium]
MSFRPSKYQQAIFDTYKNTKHNIAISAVPGSGKSTTIIELLKFVPYNRDAIFLAFNKSIVEELEKKVPQRVDVMTIHSLGAKALFREFKGQVEVSEYKIFRIAKHISHKFSVDKKKIDSYIFNISKILDLYRL